MRSAYVEFSADGGATWQKDPVPLDFAVVDAGLGSVRAFGACFASLPSGTVLFRAHGFRSPNEHGDLYSGVFPYAVTLECG
jgi:hypothetical protein